MWVALEYVDLLLPFGALFCMVFGFNVVFWLRDFMFCYMGLLVWFRVSFGFGLDGFPCY